jgi:hypothetical protein
MALKTLIRIAQKVTERRLEAQESIQIQ